MPSRGRKFIAEFLLPSLNEERFGSRLMWLDIENKVFQIQWNHKSKHDWTTSDAVVFAAWDIKKGHYNPNDKEYYSKSKQRFRAALNKFIKLRLITELLSEDRCTKIYCMGDGKNMSNSHVTVANRAKENERKENKSQIEVKEMPEGLAINLNSFWNAIELVEPQENHLVFLHNHETNKGNFIEEQLVTCRQYEIDFPDEFSPCTQYFEKENYSTNSSSDKNKNSFLKKTTNMLKESDAKSLHVEFCVPETYIYENCYHLGRIITNENNPYDNLPIVMEPTQIKWLDTVVHETDEDASFDFPIAVI